MSHIFISYSKKNKVYARKLADHLIESGFDVWIDDRIDYGENWEREIFRAIDACSVFVVIMTPESYESDWVLRECQYADRRKKPQYPLLLDGEGFPRYGTTQWVEVFGGSLPPSEFLDELAEHAPRRTAKGADVTPPQVKEDQAPKPPAHLAETIRVSRRDVESSIPLPAPPSSTPAPSRLPYVIGAGVIAAIAVITLLVMVSRGGNGSFTPTATSEDAVFIPTATAEGSTPAETSPTAVTVSDGGLVQAVSSNGEWTPVFHTLNDIGLVLVPPGCFMMGSENGAEDEQPVEEQCFNTPFWIGFGEVNNYQYQLCVNAGVCSLPADTAAYDDPTMSDHPVVNVTWEQAETYVDWVGGRLPTEAEWEYAARGPDGLIYPYGDEFDPGLENFCDANCYTDYTDSSFNDQYSETSPIGSYPDGASWVGAVDMSGNVREWTVTLYGGYPYNADDGRNELITDSGAGRVTRSGSFYSSAEDTRTTKRFESDPFGTSPEVGFRIVFDYFEQTEAIITSPEAGAVIVGDENIYGTAFYNPLIALGYTLEISGGMYGDSWEILHDEHTSSVINSWLETIYPSELEPGDYVIRLRIHLLDGSSVYSDEVPITIGDS